MNIQNPQRSSKSSVTFKELVVVVILVAVIVVLLGNSLRKAQSDTECDYQLHGVSRVLRSHETTWHLLPRGNGPGDKGEPPVSWRVALRKGWDAAAEIQNSHFKSPRNTPSQPPFKSEVSTYRLDEPWDGPNNSKLHNVENPIYRCASDPSPQIYTSYVSIQGPNTLFPDKGTCSLSSIQDKLSNTILLLEMHNSGIHWMEPKDLSVDEAINGITRKSLPYVTGRYRKGNQGTLAIFGDGRIQTINSDVDPKVLRSLIEIDNPDKNSQPYIN